MNKGRRNFLKMGFMAGRGLVAAALTQGILRAKESEGVLGLPWSYKKLDPIVAVERGYEGYYKAACAYGAFDAIIGELKKEVGHPFTVVPTERY